ncbi:MAG TPA: hypothetical protein VNH11_23660 [Pirellulales bacterium]|nr:hypothetical protein [Pirellulales bacterium]
MNTRVCRLICLAAAFVPRGAVASDGIALEDIVRIAKSARERVHAIDVTYEEHQELLDGTFPLLVPLLRGRMRFDIATGNYRWWKDSADPQANGKMFALEYALSDSTATFHNPSILQGAISQPKKPPINPLGTERVLTGALMHPPRPDGRGTDDASLVNLLKYAQLRSDPEQVGDRPCHVVDATFTDGSGVPHRYASVWLDLERGALPVRSLLYGKGDTPAVDARILEAYQFDDGQGQSVWLPTKLEAITTRAEHRVKLVVTADVKRTRINPVFENGTFVIDFPPGTTVNDLVIDKIFTVPSAGPEPISAVRRWFVLVNVVVAALIIAWWAARRRRHRQRTLD